MQLVNGRQFLKITFLMALLALAPVTVVVGMYVISCLPNFLSSIYMADVVYYITSSLYLIFNYYTIKIILHHQ